MFLAYNFLLTKYKIVYSNFLLVEFGSKLFILGIYNRTVRTILWFFDKGIVEELALGNTIIDVQKFTTPLATQSVLALGPVTTYLIVVIGLVL